VKLITYLLVRVTHKSILIPVRILDSESIYLITTASRVIALIEMGGSEMSYDEKTAIALAILFLVAFRVFFYEFGI